ncbi:MAG: hypothetical protein LBR97_08490 [Dysgonamonadaceae bacterium]|jgi:hypothetical protein|nr:hypothetical protein [Dysgonamonadaceae bacterium]
MKTTKKMRFLFLLFLIVSGTANLKAQVTIGSDQKSVDGVVLDLSQVPGQDLGFLLPRVSLANVTEWQLQGNPANGAGMLVYNTNPSTVGGNGIGVYIWTEAGVWATLKSNLSGAIGGEPCTDVPQQPGEITFTGAPVKLGGKFYATVSEEPGPNRPAFYEWTLPEGLINSSPLGYAKSNTITITGTTAGEYGVGSITVKATNACGTNEAELGSNASPVTVHSCTGAPATPGTISLSADSVNLNGTFTASVPEVNTGTQIPTSYTWILPAGLTEIGSSTKGDTIWIKGETGKTHKAGTIKVKATNACGTNEAELGSNDKDVTVRDCSAKPATPGTISLTADSVNLNGTFTAEVPEVSGVTSYTWTLTGGLDVVGDATGRTITIKGVTAGTAGTITVTATNACGTSDAQTYAGTVTVHSCTGEPGKPGAMTILVDTVNLDSPFTASIDEVSGATSYEWTLPTGLTGTSTSNTITITGESGKTYAIGDIKVKAKNACGDSEEQTSAKAVTVRNCSGAPATPGTISLTADSVNLNGTFMAEVPAVTDGTQIPTSYKWTLTGGLTGESTGRTIEIKGGTAGTTGTITVTATNACGTSAAQTYAGTVTVRSCTGAPATPGAITLTPSSPTVNLDSTFTASITAVPGATSYIWALPAGLDVTAGSGTKITIKGTKGGTYNAGDIKVAAKNDCGTSGYSTGSASVVTVKACSAKPAKPGPISIPTLPGGGVALNSTFTIFVPGVSADDKRQPTSYTWTLPSGLTPTAGPAALTTSVPSIEITSTKFGTYAKETIKVKATNDCGTSDEQGSNTEALKVHTCTGPPAKPGAITISPTTVNLNGGTITVSIEPVSGATSYGWEWPISLQLVEGNGTGRSITLKATQAGTFGPFKVQAFNDCGWGDAQTSTSSVTVVQ